MATDVTTHGNTKRSDRMELLTTSERVPERLKRLENAMASGASASGSIVVDFAADTSSYVINDLTKVAQDRVWEFIFEGVISSNCAGLYIRPNSDSANYYNRRHRHFSTDTGSTTGHDVPTDTVASLTYGLMMGTTEWGVECALLTRALYTRVGRSAIGAGWMCHYTLAPSVQVYTFGAEI